jgi:hypothetical protein
MRQLIQSLNILKIKDRRFICTTEDCAFFSLRGDKLICERERYGSKKSYHGVRRANDFQKRPGDEGENLLSREGIKRRYVHNWDAEAKSFSDKLNPLKGAVRKAVGRRWDDFYSELCSNFGPPTVVNKHIFIHLYSYIETHAFVQDGRVCVIQPYRGLVLIEDSYSEFYVDPRDGLIKHTGRIYSRRLARAAHKEKAEQERAKTFRKVSETVVMHKIDDVWFEFEMKPVPKALPGQPAEQIAIDACYKEPVTPRYRDGKYHTNKRTVSNKRLKQLGLI